MRAVLTDTGFWLGLLDPVDGHHDEAFALAGLLENEVVVFPFPCLYETLRTRLVRRRDALMQLEAILSRPKINLFPDEAYRDKALFNLLENARSFGFTYSLADCVIREMLLDVNLGIGHFITFNPGDFSDVCAIRGIEILP